MGRSPSYDDSGLKKGPWTPDEDKKLVEYVQKHGHSSWSALPKLAGLNRCGKSCRLRWTNYLRPDIKRGKFSPDEEQTILNLHAVVGNKWSTIANQLPGRTDNEIKNFWNTHLKKKLIQMGFDPMTHLPRTDIFSGLSHFMSVSSDLRGFVDLQPQFQIDQEHNILKLQTEMVKLKLFQYLLQTMNNFNPNDLGLDLSFLSSYLHDFNNLPSLKPLNPNMEPSSASLQNLDNNLFKFFTPSENLLSDPSRSSQSLLPSLDPCSAMTNDLIKNQYGLKDANSNITFSNGQDSAASASGAWPDHLLDHSIFSDIP